MQGIFVCFEFSISVRPLLIANIFSFLIRKHYRIANLEIIFLGKAAGNF